MSKTVVMFPGQGVQQKGMGEDFCKEFTESRSLFERAGRITGIDIKRLIFEENEDLNKTEFTQIALYVTEMAILAAAVKNGLSYDCAVGLSLGEYGALTACKGIEFDDCALLVRNRGVYMETAVPAGKGAMAAVLGSTGAEVENIILDSGLENVYVANFNCPGQTVISGEKESVAAAMEILKREGAKRVVELNVSGPFHSPMLKNAGEQLLKDLEKTQFGSVQIPYYANYTADIIDSSTEADELRQILSKQVYSPVKFEQSVRKILDAGFTTFIEIGPGKTLTGFVRKTAKDMEKTDIRLINIEKVSDMEALD